MKNFKKALAIILSAVLMCSLLSVSAFAEAVTTTDDTNKDVTGTYVAGSEAATVYSVSIAWGGMAFTYTAASAGTWNTTDLKYDDVGSAKWSCEADANKITVTNKSNAPVYASFLFTDNAEDSIAITGAFYQEAAFSNVISSSVEIAAATPGVGGNNGTATTADTYLKLTGDLPSTGFDSATTIGSITITILDAAS